MWVVVVVVVVVFFFLAGISALPSARKVDIMYRNSMVRGVEVTSLYDDICVRFSAALKSAAVAQDLLLPCEHLLGLHDVTEGTQMAAITPSLVAQAALHTHIYTHTSFKHCVVIVLCVCVVGCV